jgi:hypothetical protein
MNHFTTLSSDFKDTLHHFPKGGREDKCSRASLLHCVIEKDMAQVSLSIKIYAVSPTVVQETKKTERSGKVVSNERAITFVNVVNLSYHRMVFIQRRIASFVELNSFFIQHYDNFFWKLPAALSEAVTP